MIKNVQIWKLHRPYIEMMVEKHKKHRYDQKFFVAGFLMGIVPYIIHMKF
jgi:hypothetical protein|tara:strand:+ start:717 stop:866 length:150 start_codon:yes stop_codon:yes gene_type:complete